MNTTHGSWGGREETSSPEATFPRRNVNTYCLTSVHGNQRRNRQSKARNLISGKWSQGLLQNVILKISLAKSLTLAKYSTINKTFLFEDSLPFSFRQKTDWWRNATAERCNFYRVLYDRNRWMFSYLITRSGSLFKLKLWITPRYDGTESDIYIHSRTFKRVR